MKIAGIGMIASPGFGIASFEQSLQKGWQRPADVELARIPGKIVPAYQVNLDSVQDRTLLKKIRRSDKLSKMCVLAAADCLDQSAVKTIDRTTLGVIVATAFGAHTTTFSFLDDILDYGDAAVSPTTFSNSVHNAAASYVSSSLSIQGPTLTVTQFQFSFQAALQLAQTWLDQRRCEQVLVGAADQYGDVLAYVSDQKLTTAKDGRIKPFLFNPTCQVPGEGAVFFLVNRDDAGPGFCRIDAVRTFESGPDQNVADLLIIDANGMMADESVYVRGLSLDIPTAAYAPLVGSMMVGSAFNCAAGALMLRGQVLYATPVQDNPRNIRLLTETGSTRINSIRCRGYNCYAEPAVIDLARL